MIRISAETKKKKKGVRSEKSINSATNCALTQLHNFELGIRCYKLRVVKVST